MGGIRVGVIGCGYWGPNLIRNFVEITSADLVGVADLSAARLARIKTLYPAVAVTEDYRDLIEMRLDAVVIATPPPSHFPIARDCLLHGLHVMVEKPFTLSSRHARDLIEIAEARNLVLMVGHTFLYNCAVQTLKEIVDSGDLGDIYYVDAARLSLGLFQPSLNVLWDLAPHDISIVLYLLGTSPVAVSAHGMACVFGGLHDVVYVNMEMPGGILAHVHVSWLDPCKVRRITVVGSKKMVVFNDVETLEKIKIYDRGVDAPPYTETYGEFQCSYRYGNVLIPRVPAGEPLRLECQHFLECIETGDQPRSSGIEGLKVVEILEDADRSLRNGAACELPLTEGHCEPAIAS